MIETFAVSLAVAIICIFFARKQAKELAGAIEMQRKPASKSDLGDAPEIVASLVSHSLDVAFNFPATVLTLVAYWHIFPGQWSTVAIIVLAVIVGLFFQWIIYPTHASAYGRLTRLLRVSPITLVLVVANVVGLVVAILLSST